MCSSFVDKMMTIKSPDELLMLCRVCLSREENVVNIFTMKGSNGQKYAEVIKQCANITVSRDDKLPSKICNRCFIQIESYIDLVSKCIESDLFLKNMCGLSTNSENNTKDTEVAQDSEMLFKCTQCSKAFKSQHMLDQHTKNHSAILQNEPDQPETVFDEQINSAVDDQAEEPSYKCKNCEKEYVIKSAYLKHMQKSELEGCYKLECNQCDYVTGHRGTLNRHLRTHDLKKNEECEVCNELCGQKDELRIHIEEAHKSFDINLYKCDYCEKSYKRKYTLGRHRTIHTRENLFTCDRCKKVFYEKTLFRQHKQKHVRRQF